MTIGTTSAPPPPRSPRPQFSALGLGCAAAAVLLYEGVRVSELALRPLPRVISAPLAGALCGAIAYKFPQVGGRVPGHRRWVGKNGHCPTVPYYTRQLNTRPRGSSHS